MLTHVLADGRVVGERLGDDITRPGEGVVGRFDACLRVDVPLGLAQHVVRLPRQQPFRERLQPALAGDAGARAPLRPERAVNVFDLLQARRRVERRGNIGRKLVLLRDRRLTSSLRAASERKYASRVATLRNCSSSMPPVCSLR